MSSRAARSNHSRAAVALAALFPVVLAGCDSITGGEDCSGGTRIEVGDVVTGTLEAGDDLDVDGAYLDRFALEVNEDGTVTITLTSDDFDAWLWLLEEDESVVASDDDGAGGLNSEISMSLDQGCYLIDATSLGEGETGDYTLEVDG